MAEYVLEAAWAFGITFKDKQFETMATFLSGRHVFVSLLLGVESLKVSPLV